MMIKNTYINQVRFTLTLIKDNGMNSNENKHLSKVQVKVTWVRWSLCCVRFVVLSPFDRFATYLAQMQPIKQYVVHNFQINRPKVKV